MPKKVAKEYYVDNKEFYRLIIEQKREEKKRNWEKLGEIFLKIATRYLNKPNFIQYSLDRKQDMISESIFLMTLRWKSFDETRYTNPFAYFTEVAKNAVNKYLGERTKEEKVISRISFIDTLGEDEE